MKRLYARVSTLDQELDSQIETLKKFAKDDEYVLYHEKLSGKDTIRQRCESIFLEEDVSLNPKQCLSEMYAGTIYHGVLASVVIDFRIRLYFSHGISPIRSQ